jgi:hypothetical protein
VLILNLSVKKNHFVALTAERVRDLVSFNELVTMIPEVNEANWFQQDGVTSHNSRVSTDALRLQFIPTSSPGNVTFLSLQDPQTRHSM